MRFNKMTYLLPLQFEHDTVLVPKETSWFGYYPDGAFSPLLQYIGAVYHTML